MIRAVLTLAASLFVVIGLPVHGVLTHASAGLFTVLP